MSVLQYGPDGREISLQILEIRLYEQVPVMNGPDFLYTRHALHAVCQFNPGATSYTLPAVIPNFPVVAPPPPAGVLNTAPYTAVALQYWLEQPRQHLIFSVEDNRLPTRRKVILESPPRIPPGAGGGAGVVTVPTLPTGLPEPTAGVLGVDAKNGPFPLYCRVKEIQGTRTMVVEYGIETYLNDQQLNPLDPALLSNRWTQRRTYDQDLYTTIRMDGLVVFDMSVLARLGRVAPDSLSSRFSFPVPDGFRRIETDAEQLPDGTSVHYWTVDREEPLQIVQAAGPILAGGLASLVGAPAGAVGGFIETKQISRCEIQESKTVAKAGVFDALAVASMTSMAVRNEVKEGRRRAEERAWNEYQRRWLVYKRGQGPKPSPP